MVHVPRSLEEVEGSQSTGKDGLSGGTETILLVEDDDEFRETALNLLAGLGYNVLQSAGADYALGILKSGRHIDLLLTDVGLPDRTGEELAQEAGAIHPDLPVIFATAGVDVAGAAALGQL